MLADGPRRRVIDLAPVEGGPGDRRCITGAAVVGHAVVEGEATVASHSTENPEPVGGPASRDATPAAMDEASTAPGPVQRNLAAATCGPAPWWWAE